MKKIIRHKTNKAVVLICICSLFAAWHMYAHTHFVHIHIIYIYYHCSTFGLLAGFLGVKSQPELTSEYPSLCACAYTRIQHRHEGVANAITILFLQACNLNAFINKSNFNHHHHRLHSWMMMQLQSSSACASCRQAGNPPLAFSFLHIHAMVFVIPVDITTNLLFIRTRREDGHHKINERDDCNNKHSNNGE